ncbi:FAD-dependent oxidoreductase [Pseudosporangium ferrugineum]|uniref:2-polyprenyl-6-methoxyphenol hydroxylase-like FAD-dependent oxidoreductase n=1 Tax=Pseudosporangium ferrugineum TaxID=439699 RepID=A0A2T0SEP3_9ACTN|nr:FAD-dependent monooxygenase [Pseudosporangium ferrugineum]PRY31813.1 2-polyprenyl-6-methoxyphenol hydroxylase-like FAD-dependent oxidoreductase [Pseudosporangium ferrugineum]
MASAARTFATIGSVEPPTGAPAGLDRVVVLGGSMAGLLAARVLADHAATVVVIERDTLTDVVAPRRGVPQGTQVHALLQAGGRQLERWFPGFDAGARAAGAQPISPQQWASYTDGVRKPVAPIGDALTATRPFLEQQVRERVRELPNVKIINGRVTGLDFNATEVTGVRYESDGDGGHEPADLVVDATGRASKVSDWLTAAGWDAPPMTRQITGINYATAFFRRPPGRPDIGAALCALTPAKGGDLAGVAFSAVENDRWIVMMGGYGTCRPGETAEDLIRRCRQDFPEPFGRAVSHGIIGDVITYRQADSRRRDWAKAGRLPARLLAVGDAVASFNPIYGQGMSSAALHASCLSMFLRSGPDLTAPARPFFDLQQVVVDAAWATSTAGDRARPSINLPPRGLERVRASLAGMVVEATTVDPVLALGFAKVTQMIEHPAVLATPGSLWRAWRARSVPRPRPVPPLEAA